MKRFILLAAAALGGSFCFVQPASAMPASLDGPAPVPHRSAVVPASDPAPRVTRAVRAPAPLPRYTVMTGDTLTAIGASTHRTWQQLAGYNHVPDPNLILVGQTLTIPPASYTAPNLFAPSTPVRSQYTSQLRNQQVSTPVSQTPTAPVPVQAAPSGSFQSCVAWRESGNGSGSSDIYGFLQSTWSSLGLGGSPYTASRAQQDYAFHLLYNRDGVAPWAPYDGCTA